MRTWGMGVMLFLAVATVGKMGCGLPNLGGGGSSGGEGRLTAKEGGISAGSGPHIESEGLVVVEAEHFTRTAPDELGGRHWYLQPGFQDGPGPDPDGFHEGASGNTYMELLPDTRVTHAHSLGGGAFYENEGGATLDYEILFQTPGTYYVWVRSYSTGTEDNGMHVGINGTLPDSGRRIQCCGQNKWTWSNHKRDSGGSSCGVRGTITIDVPEPGLHTITFHQREDGFEFDRFILTTSADDKPADLGPPESPRLLP